MLATAIGAALIGVLLYAGGVLDQLEQQSVTARYSVRGNLNMSNFVFVGIDNAAIKTLGSSFPYPRRDDAYVIDYLKVAGARAIGVDLQFSTQTDTYDDNLLIRSARNVVLASTEWGTGKYRGQTPIFAGHYDGAKVGISLFPEDANGGVIRHALYELGGIQSFPVVLAEQVTGRHVPASVFPENMALIDYPGPPGTVREISYADVLCAQAPRAGDAQLVATCKRNPDYVSPVTAGDFAHKIVVVGSAVPILQDQHVTPTGAPMYGGELMLDATHSIMRGNPLSYAPGGLDIVLIVLFGLAVPLVRLRFNLAVTLSFAVVLAAVYLVIAQLAFDGGTILTFVYPLVALVIGTAAANALDYLTERHHRELAETQLARLPGHSADFFISYRREQSSWPAGILRGALVERFGESSVFMDLDSISAGETWPMRIEEAIRASEVMLVLIGPGWADARAADGTRRLADPGDWVRRELETGLATPRCAVVPVLLDGAPMPAPEALPEALAPLTLRNAFALSASNWDAELTQLIDSIQHGRVREFLARERAGSAAEDATAQA